MTIDDTARSDETEGFVSISCEDCTQQDAGICDDCVVTFLCRNEPSAVVIDMVEVRALRTLSDGGLAPQLRHSAATAR